MTVEPRPRNKYSRSYKSPAKTGLVLVRYRDHVLFRRVPAFGLEPMVRETVGWIVRQDEDAIILVNDRLVAHDDDVDLDDVDLPVAEGTLPSGFIILRSCIKEVVTLA